MKIPITNKTFLKLDEVGDIIEGECRRLMSCPEEIRSLTLLPWVEKVIESF